MANVAQQTPSPAPLAIRVPNRNSSLRYLLQFTMNRHSSSEVRTCFELFTSLRMDLNSDTVWHLAQLPEAIRTKLLKDMSAISYVAETCLKGVLLSVQESVEPSSTKRKLSASTMAAIRGKDKIIAMKDKLITKLQQRCAQLKKRLPKMSTTTSFFKRV